MAKIALIASRGNTSQNAGTGYGVFGNTVYLHSSGDDNARTMRTAGVASGLYIRVRANTRTVSSDFAIRINGADGNQVVSIPSSTTGDFEDTSNTDSIASGDEVNYRMTVGTGGSSFTFVVVRCLFAATTNTVTRVGSADHDNISAASTRVFYAIGGRIATGSTTETGELINVKTAGTFKNLVVGVGTNARSTTTNVGVRLNGADSALLVAVASSTTGFFEDTSNTVTVAVDDTTCFYILTGTGTGNFRCVRGFQFDIETTDDSWQIFCGQATAAAATVAANLTRYRPLGGLFDDDISTEADAQHKMGVACTLSDLQVRVTSNTVSATSTVRVRKNAADSALSLTISSNTTGLFQDTSNSESIGSTDDVNYSIVTGSTGTALGITCVSVVGAPALPAELGSALTGSGSIAAAMTTAISMAASMAGSGAVAAALSTGISMATSLSGSGSISADLTVEQQMAASLSGSGSVSADLSTGIAMASSLAGTGSVAADLTTAISMASAIAGSGTVTAGLSTAVTMAASLSGSGAVAADLSTAISMAGSLQGSGAVTADMTAGIQLSASLSGTGSVTSAMTTAIAMASSLAGSALIAAALTTAIAMASGLQGTGSVNADLTVSANLSASVTGSGAVTADLSTAIAMAAAMAGNGSMTAGLTTTIAMAIGLTGQATITADLSTNITMAALLTGGATVTAGLTTAITMGSSLVGSGLLTPSLTTTIAMGATLPGSGFLSGTLTTPSISGVLGYLVFGPMSMTDTGVRVMLAARGIMVFGPSSNQDLTFRPSPSE